jgi:hypothetical protein
MNKRYKMWLYLIPSQIGRFYTVYSRRHFRLNNHPAE